MSILEHIKILFRSIWGLIIVFFVSLWNFIQPEKYAFSIVFCTVMLDLFWGIIVAKFIKKVYTTSEALRETLKKGSIYGTSLLTILAIERILHDQWFIGFKIACAIAASCELISVFALMLIVKPDMPFLKLFTSFLKGEISKKLNVNANEIFIEEKKQKKDKDNNNEVISF